MCLSELRQNSDAVVKSLNGDQRFISRITSIGLTPGCSVRVLRNDKNMGEMYEVCKNRNDCYNC